MQHGWRKRRSALWNKATTTLLLPCLDNVNVPYADDSRANSPPSSFSVKGSHKQPTEEHHSERTFRIRAQSNIDRVCGLPMSKQQRSMSVRRASRPSIVSQGPSSRRPSTYNELRESEEQARERHCEPTHFHWTTSSKARVLIECQPKDSLPRDKTQLQVSYNMQQLTRIVLTFINKIYGTSSNIRLFVSIVVSTLI